MPRKISAQKVGGYHEVAMLTMQENSRFFIVYILMLSQLLGPRKTVKMAFGLVVLVPLPVARSFQLLAA